MSSRFRQALCVTLFLAGGSLSSGWAQALDQYGGYTGLTGHNTSGFFRLEKIGDRYYLITPDNHAMISIAMTGILYYDSWGAYCPPINSSPSAWAIRAQFNNDQTAWQAAMKANLAAWGFNGIGSWSQQGVPNMTENAVVLGITGTATSAGVPSVGRNFADVWHPTFAAKATQQANSLTSYANSHFRIGAFPDNELGWVGADAWGTGGDKLPDLFIKLPATAYGKQYWANTLLAGKYATIADLNTAYGTAFTSFAGSESTSLINVTALPNDSAHPAIFADKQDFMEAIANQYYSTVSSAMRAKDPNHLVFSSRWAFWTTGYDTHYAEQQAYNERVWRAEGRYCDIIAVNGYPHTDWLETNYQFYSRMFAANGGKPFMITEYSASANDARYSFRDPMSTTWTIWCTYPYQRYRGEDYVAQMKGSLDLSLTDPGGAGSVHPYLGLQWFYYVDEPSLGRPDGEGNNCGLLNVPDEIYTTALDVIGSFNRQLYGYLVDGTGIALLNAPAPTSPPVSPVFSSASATSTLPGGWIANNVMDRNPSSVWSSVEQSETGNQSLTVNFSGPASLLALLVRPRSFTVPNACTFPRDFKIQYSSAGQWLDLTGQVYSDYPNPGKAVQCFACASPLTTTAVRISATKFNTDDTGKYFMQIADVWVVTGPHQSPRPTFAWSPVSGAASYTLLYSPEQTFPDAQTIRIEGIIATSWTPPDPLAAGLWYWCVRAVDAAGRGGKYSDPVAFWVDPGTSVTTSDALGLENLSVWRNLPLEAGGWDGTAWAFHDTDQKTTGNASARVVFTMNSMNKLTGAKNTRTGRVAWQYAGPSRWYPLADQVRFDVRSARATDAAGAMTVASKFISIRVKDAAGATLLDQRIDPDGTLPPLTWQTRTFALSLPHDRSISLIEVYLDMAATSMNPPWDQRLTLWIDNLAFTPAIPRADFDMDLDVDQSDFGHLQACLSGPGIAQNQPECLDAHLDTDDDVDGADLAVFLRCFSGPGVVADPACAD